MNPSGFIFRRRPIDMDMFFIVSDDTLLQQVRQEFPEDVDRLKRAYSISSPNAIPPSTLSPSQLLYGTQYDEVNRTLVSVLSLRWIYRGQYEVFTGTQPGPVALVRSSFDWMRGILMELLKDPMDLYALLTYVVINDLGKDPQLATDYHAKTGKDVSRYNHDIVLLKAVEAGLVASFNRLPPQYKDRIMSGLQLSARFNPGQLAQAENAPACLTGLEQVGGEAESFKFHYMQQLLDIAGAAGHEDWTCAKKLIEPIARAYQDVYEVAMDVSSGRRGVREAYDMILARRSRMLCEKGFRKLDIRRSDDRALTRLLCMGGVFDVQRAALYESTWESLDADTRLSLIHSLNVDGSVEEPAVQPTYMPAMLAQGLGDRGLTWSEDNAQRLRSMLRYLSRVMTLVEEPDGKTIVVERSVLRVLKDVVQSREFEEDSTVLDGRDVPEGAIIESSD